MKLWKRKQTLRDNLQQRLPALAVDYFEAGRAGLAEGTAWSDMHQFRLATKRFRYTLEIFESAYGPGLQPADRSASFHPDAARRHQRLHRHVRDAGRRRWHRIDPRGARRKSGEAHRKTAEILDRSVRCPGAVRPVATVSGSVRVPSKAAAPDPPLARP